MQDTKNRIPANTSAEMNQQIQRAIGWNPSVRQLTWHFLSGAGLGSSLALSLLATHGLFTEALAASASPAIYLIGCVTISASIIGVGSAITSALFCALEKT
jgi:hypothetical protein